jgi:hypothetical protein
MAPSARPFGHRLLRTSLESILEQAVVHRPGVWVLRQQVGNPEESVLEQLRLVAASTSAGGITKEEQRVTPSGLLGDRDMGCRDVAIQYTTLEIEHYNRP